MKRKFLKNANYDGEKMNMHIKKLSIIFIIIIMLLCISRTVFAQNNIKNIKVGNEISGTFTQTLISHSNDLTPGKQIEVGIQISDIEEATNVYVGYVKYDTSVLRYIETTGQNGWRKLFFDDYETLGDEAEGELSLSRTASDSVVAQGEIVTLKFEVLQDVEETEVAVLNAYMLDADKMYTADDTKLNIKEDQWTITYDVNDGIEESKPESKTANIHKDITIATQKPIREGYIFLGWTKDKSSKQVDFQGGESATYEQFGAEPNADSNKNVTLYAVWLEEHYDIIYYWNGGETGPENTQKVYGTDYTIEHGPTKEGYIFSGWYDIVAQKIYEENQTYSEEKNLYLVAQWTPVTYIITLNVNDGILPDGEANQKSAVFESELQLPIPTREGYTFKGWFNDSNINVGSSLIVTKNETLEAQWEETIYTITYDVNEGEGTFHAQSRTINQDNIEIWKAEPKKEGYKFVGWLSSSDDKIYSPQGNNIYSLLQSSTFTAQWESLKYTISYMPNSDEVTGSIEKGTKGYNTT